MRRADARGEIWFSFCDLSVEPARNASRIHGLYITREPEDAEREISEVRKVPVAQRRERKNAHGMHGRHTRYSAPCTRHISRFISVAPKPRFLATYNASGTIGGLC